MIAVVVSFLLSVLFGMGLVMGGMTQPAKVIGFLDIFGHWDPSLMCVMAGALAVYMPVYQWLVRKRARPLLGEQFLIGTPQSIDRRLILGAALFGAGWGLAGFCPAPAITALGAGVSSAAIFTVAMCVGFGLGELFRPSPRKASPLQP